ncbi:hypothetical protein B0H14DRAFT_2560644 [Mycena olivaceomarginata]|nr:hypothetical protein B0H14DRAFT_2560644 [Mycena olivaceomarginata]
MSINTTPLNPAKICKPSQALNFLASDICTRSTQTPRCFPCIAFVFTCTVNSAYPFQCTFLRATPQVPSWITRKDPAIETDASSTTGQRRGSRALSSKERGDPSGFPPLSRTPCPRTRGAFHLCSCVFHGTGAFRTTHTKLTTFTRICFYPPVPKPPKFHSPDIPLDAEVLHGAARYLPAVATDERTPIPPFLRPLSHLTNFISGGRSEATAYLVLNKLDDGPEEAYEGKDLQFDGARLRSSSDDVEVHDTEDSGLESDGEAKSG